MIDVPRIRMTDAEYFELPPQSQPIELINGELVVNPAPVPRHQNVMLNTAFVLKDLLPIVGGKVFAAPLEVYLGQGQIPQPDVMWIAPDSKCIIDDKRLMGPPDLVVEIFSPGSVVNDRGDKFDLYQRYGVREYWMIDPSEEYIEVFTLVNNLFIRQGIYATGKQFTSPVLGGAVIDTTKIFEW
ncbi:MAG: Uma2 family endonuclease [Chloroflexi bacterium]|nr:Uma2 family endonuclease [Chloroflexota bacterium]MCC6895678.1 Uma2 family endonuclease [Anaerolineae bacterium]